VRTKNERVELEMKIMKARQLARGADDTTRERLEALAAELEQKQKRSTCKIWTMTTTLLVVAFALAITLT
jgi:hypothetical protein